MDTPGDFNATCKALMRDHDAIDRCLASHIRICRACESASSLCTRLPGKAGCSECKGRKVKCSYEEDYLFGQLGSVFHGSRVLFDNARSAVRIRRSRKIQVEPAIDSGDDPRAPSPPLMLQPGTQQPGASTREIVPSPLASSSADITSVLSSVSTVGHPLFVPPASSPSTAAQTSVALDPGTQPFPSSTVTSYFPKIHSSPCDDFNCSVVSCTQKHDRVNMRVETASFDDTTITASSLPLASKYVDAFVQTEDPVSIALLRSAPTPDWQALDVDEMTSLLQDYEKSFREIHDLLLAEVANTPVTAQSASRLASTVFVLARKAHFDILTATFVAQRRLLTPMPTKSKDLDLVNDLMIQLQRMLSTMHAGLESCRDVAPGLFIHDDPTDSSSVSMDTS
ncbi:hypothetical protein C8J57DRAFT_1712018 [Mycena rebaudengoi]|nr:hypothetical protein C8J57DRAFT_1712018 [Mycena rebaudengoi]